MLLARARATTQYICTYDNSVNSEVTYENVTSNPSISANLVTVTGIDSPDSDVVVIQGIEYPRESSPTEHDLQGPVIVEETSLGIQPRVFEETADYEKTAKDDCLVAENTYRDLLEVWLKNHTGNCYRRLDSQMIISRKCASKNWSSDLFHYLD